VTAMIAPQFPEHPRPARPQRSAFFRRTDRSSMMVRLVWMAGVLMSGRDLTRDAYNERFSTPSERTYRRDVDTLREAGFRLEPLVYLGRTEVGHRLLTFRPELEAV
jgi:hypothetical protein